MLVTEIYIYRDEINILNSQLNPGMASFGFNYNNVSREPEDVTLFLDKIYAPYIDSRSVCYIYQLLNALNTKVYGSGLSADF